MATGSVRLSPDIYETPLRIASNGDVKRPIIESSCVARKSLN
jgi:hypothetical protein